MSFKMFFVSPLYSEITDYSVKKVKKIRKITK